MKYDIQFTNQFKKDLKLAKKQNKSVDKLFEIIDILANGGDVLVLRLCRLGMHSELFKKQGAIQLQSQQLFEIGVNKELESKNYGIYEQLNFHTK